jgi:hypothetical protein
MDKNDEFIIALRRDAGRDELEPLIAKGANLVAQDRVLTLI